MLKLAKECWEGCRSMGRAVVRTVATRVKTVVVTVAGWFGVSSVAWATDPPPITLPDSGVDLPGHITAAILAMGSVVAVVVGG